MYILYTYMYIYIFIYVYIYMCQEVFYTTCTCEYAIAKHDTAHSVQTRARNDQKHAQHATNDANKTSPKTHVRVSQRAQHARRQRCDLARTPPARSLRRELMKRSFAKQFGQNVLKEID